MKHGIYLGVKVSNLFWYLLLCIDDKLNRIQKGAGLVANDEDVIQDLIGYLILLKIALKREAKKHEV